ncbi:hypothetical protein C0991_002387 [Blastosporella zonata]|nr:hypothetical protein C0991_002387 [Blastosporella zonata]
MPALRTKDRVFKRSVEEALARSAAGGSLEKRGGLTDAPVRRTLQRATINNYPMISFATTLQKGWANDPNNNLGTSKAFAYFLASGIPGRERGSKPSQSSVVQAWKNLTAGWPFDNRGEICPVAKNIIKRELPLFTYLCTKSEGPSLQFIYGEITEIFQLPLRKRIRRFAAGVFHRPALMRVSHQDVDEAEPAAAAWCGDGFGRARQVYTAAEAEEADK